MPPASLMACEHVNVYGTGLTDLNICKDTISVKRYTQVLKQHMLLSIFKEAEILCCHQIQNDHIFSLRWYIFSVNSQNEILVYKLYIQHITFFWAVSNLLGIVLYLQECT